MNWLINAGTARTAVIAMDYGRIFHFCNHSIIRSCSLFLMVCMKRQRWIWCGRNPLFHPYHHCHYENVLTLYSLYIMEADRFWPGIFHDFGGPGKIPLWFAYRITMSIYQIWMGYAAVIVMLFLVMALYSPGLIWGDEPIWKMSGRRAEKWMQKYRVI